MRRTDPRPQRARRCRARMGSESVFIFVSSLLFLPAPYQQHLHRNTRVVSVSFFCQAFASFLAGGGGWWHVTGCLYSQSRRRGQGLQI